MADTQWQGNRPMTCRRIGWAILIVLLLGPVLVIGPALARRESFIPLCRFKAIEQYSARSPLVSNVCGNATAPPLSFWTKVRIEYHGWIADAWNGLGDLMGEPSQGEVFTEVLRRGRAIREREAAQTHAAAADPH